MSKAKGCQVYLSAIGSGSIEVLQGGGYHGVFAPHPALRAGVTPARRGRRVAPDPDTRTPAERHAAMSWAQRLKRVFHIDVETCAHCGGRVQIIACIEDPVVIRHILDHLERRAAAAHSAHPSRAPPAAAVPKRTVS